MERPTLRRQIRHLVAWLRAVRNGRFETAFQGGRHGGALQESHQGHLSENLQLVQS